MEYQWVRATHPEWGPSGSVVMACEQTDSDVRYRICWGPWEDPLALKLLATEVGTVEIAREDKHVFPNAIAYGPGTVFVPALSFQEYREVYLDCGDTDVAATAKAIVYVRQLAERHRNFASGGWHYTSIRLEMMARQGAIFPRIVSVSRTGVASDLGTAGLNRIVIGLKNEAKKQLNLFGEKFRCQN